MSTEIPFPPLSSFIPPQKHSVSLRGHPTSISLEPLFMNQLSHIAQRYSLSVASLISEIDAFPLPLDNSLNLSSKLRIYVLWDLLHQAKETPPEKLP